LSNGFRDSGRETVTDQGLIARWVEDGTLLGGLARGLSRRAYPIVSRFEEICFGEGAPAFPPLFIVGLPRAGTTLVYQAICHALQVSFVPELNAYLPVAPALTSWAAQIAGSDYKSSFTSHYGSSPGLTSPSEGLIWNLWFEKNRHYDDTSDLAPGIARAIRGTVGRIERIGRGLFVSKNLRNDNRVRCLAHLFPHALFLVVVRRPSDVATSLMVGRSAMAGSIDSWFSIRPRNYPALRDEPPAVQVAGQIAGLLRDLEDDIEAVGDSRFALVAYEDFCSRPGRFLDELIDFIAGSATPPARRHDLPEAYDLPSPRPSALDDTLRAALDEAVASSESDSRMAGMPGTWLAKCGARTT